MAYNIQHGRATPRTDIYRFDGINAHFRNGEMEAYDHIILATGYNFTIPYVEPEVFDWEKCRPRRTLAAFHEERDDNFLIGFLETSGAARPVVDLTSSSIAQYIATPSAKRQRVRIKFTRLSRSLARILTPGTKLIQSARHEGYADYVTLQKCFLRLHRKMGWSHGFIVRDCNRT